MGKIVNFAKGARSRNRRPRKLEAIKEELLKYHGIDLDQLIASEPATTLTLEEFELLTDRILESIDLFCEEHPSATVHDVLYTLENVREIIKDTVEPD